MTKCIMLLSSKSAGSSALQNLVTSIPHVHHVAHTTHREHETLYWTKAASILGLPQNRMLDSEVPIPARHARRELSRFLQGNLGQFETPDDDRTMVFEGWRMLCERYAPVFFEKSPHHLHQWSALQLINECVGKLQHIEFLLIGLVRNPMDTIYSRWSGGRSLPERYQYEWLRAYRNLVRFQEIADAKLIVIRYEDMVSDPHALRDIYYFAGNWKTEPDSDYLHTQSIAKWKRDPHYGFQLDRQVAELAMEFGYQRGELENTHKRSWFLAKYMAKSTSRIVRPYRLLRRKLKRFLSRSA